VASIPRDRAPTPQEATVRAIMDDPRSRRRAARAMLRNNRSRL
jgi:hypothetical protein